MTENPTVTDEFAEATQYLFSQVDNVVHTLDTFKNRKAGYLVGITLPDSKDGTHKIVSWLSDPSHPEVIEDMVNKFFKRSAYTVFPIETKDG